MKNQPTSFTRPGSARLFTIYKEGVPSSCLTNIQDAEVSLADFPIRLRDGLDDLLCPLGTSVQGTGYDPHAQEEVAVSS